MILNQETIHALSVGFRSAHSQGFRLAQPFRQRVATLVPSTHHTENYGWLGEFPGLREWLGDRHIKSISAHGFAIKNRKFESTISVPVDDIEDDTYGVYGPIFQEMGYAASVHPDQLVFELLVKGFETQCYDGQYFFDADHPVGDQSVSNVQAGAGNPWFLMDTRRALKPIIYQRRRDYALRQMNRPDDEQVFMAGELRYGVDGRGNAGFGFWQQAFGSRADLNQDNFNEALTSMMRLRSDEDRPLGIKPDVLVHGPSLRVAALEVLKVDRLENGKTNINQGAVEAVLVPWLP